MSIAPWPDHLLTLEEWDALPEDTSRHYELVDGVLIVAPRPAPKHQLAGAKLVMELNRQFPMSLAAVPDVEVIIDAAHPATIRAPDVVVTSTSRFEENPARLNAVDVILAVEIVSPGSRKMDRLLKPVEYADAGIPYYWLIDLHAPASLTAFLLVDGNYEIIADATENIALSEPAPITLDVRTLARR